MLSAIGWIALTLWDSIGQLPTSLGALRLDHIAIAGIPAMLSVYITAHIYFLVLSGIVPQTLSFHSVALPFFAAQVVRYLPGKVWGIIYIAQATAGWIPSRYTVRANIVQFTLMTFNSIVVATSVYAYYRKGILPALVTYAVLLLIVYGISITDLLQRAASLILRAHEYQRSNSNRVKNLLLLTLLQAEWLVYLTACKLILPGHISFGDSVIIATIYAVAWLAGALAIILPGGLFVREGSFLWLSGLLGYNAADMFLFSIFARILFTLCDVVCAVIGLALMRSPQMAQFDSMRGQNARPTTKDSLAPGKQEERVKE